MIQKITNARASPMSNIDKLNDHELVDLKRDIERELKRRAEGPKITTYYVVSC
ncbi:DUF5448 family protein, partial [Salmonella enterica]|uniref:DUF5448 family protein n=1 Tax=Salmonella enterica TaxID=28901 RepID=UPI003CC55497